MSVIKIEKSLDREYAPLILWWDDVTEIFNLLKDHCKSVELVTSHYKFATLESAKDHLGTTPQYDLKISGSSPYVVVEASRLHVSSGPSSAMLYVEIDNLLSRRQRWPKWIYQSWLGGVVIALGFVIYPISEGSPKALLLSVQGLLCALFIRSAFINMKRGLVVHTQKKSEARNFIQRNKDQLIMYVLTGVVGAVVGFGISQMKDRYFPPSAQTK